MFSLLSRRLNPRSFATIGLSVGSIGLIAASNVHAREYYSEVRVEEVNYIFEEDALELENGVKDFIKRDVSKYDRMLREGFNKNDIHVDSSCIKCRSNRDLLIEWIQKKYPNYDFSKATCVEIEEKNFCSAYDDDDYTVETTWPSICVSVRK